MSHFLQAWQQAALTSIGFFWMAFWAFALGYLISSLIQVLVTRERMQRMMGESGPTSVALGTFFGFISSSCSFAALSTTRALFQKGAGLVPALAFMLASTNLVIELGVVIALFLSWQFVVGEYLGGLLLIGLAWLFIRLTRPGELIRQARQRGDDAQDQHNHEHDSWYTQLLSRAGWEAIAAKYVMEWQMVWRDVLIGFTVAGIIAAFVPDAFFQMLFIGAGGAPGEQSFVEVLAQVVAGPVAAFFTFIGSMGNIPLAAVLFDHGVSFAGVMAFIFSDLVVLPVLRINARYYGWKMALYILLLLLTCLICAALLLHYGFWALDLLPQRQDAGLRTLDLFQLNYGLVLNLLFLSVSAILGWLWWQHSAKSDHEHGHDHAHHSNGSDGALGQRVLRVLSWLAMLWLGAGLATTLIP
ncbi:membrane protein [Marinobacterium zhoushanense]|uniref:Membrane protein n=1 Tax=Marinobacterium zhoushanense TaxID=1679163 RepID=A0ABQ1KK83_9GAMM|nr:permease [Marinobacterium zhoushanense]GGB99384.1 membrane protein [Marinobacterium zhoushanense]